MNAKYSFLISFLTIEVNICQKELVGGNTGVQDGDQSSVSRTARVTAWNSDGMFE